MMYPVDFVKNIVSGVVFMRRVTADFSMSIRVRVVLRTKLAKPSFDLRLCKD